MSPEKVIRLTQSLNYRLSSREVGVMNVRDDGTGRVVAHLSVYDPATSKDEDLRVGIDDEITIGSERYRVVATEKSTASERCWLELSPIGGGGAN